MMWGLDFYLFLNALLTLITMLAVAYIILRKKIIQQKYEKLIKLPLLIIKHPSFRSAMIDENTYSKVNKFLMQHKNKPVAMLLHTNGGTVFDSLRISKLILQHGKVNMIVPHKAMSGGTLLAVSAQKVICRKTTAFGDLNPQMQHITFLPFYGEKALKKHMGKKNMQDKIHLDYLSDAKNELYNILTRKNSRLAFALTEGNLSHAQIIDPSTLKEFGVNIFYGIKSCYPDKLL